MTRRISVLFLAFASLLWSYGCSAPSGGMTVDPNAYLTIGPGKECELNIRSSFLGHVEPGSLRLTRRRIYSSWWIYVPARVGRWSAQEVIVTPERGKRTYPFPIMDLKGYVELTTDTFIVNLQLPIRSDGKTTTGYQPLDKNGTYRVSTTKPVPFPDEGAPPSGEDVYPPGKSGHS